ncbi:sigma-70 family RNA polymerase sigma factor [Salinarimonas sp.]|uniref:sigma-70 family RNA polymerase sigma factor n=1 Tax=Salinarimonas sp. TaxID=2766526 RepID=UPI00391A772B
MARRELADQLTNEVASLRRYALVLTRKPDEAEDLVQECLARAIAAAHSWQPGSDLRAWLFRIMHNAFIDHVRKQRVRDAAQPALAETAESPVQPHRVELAQVLDALRGLPDHYREPIVLVAIEEMSYSDAARVLDVPLGTFMSRLARGREALRRVVRGEKSPHLRLVS